MSKKKKAKKSRAALDGVGESAVAMLEAIPGARAVLKPLRKAAKASGYTRLVTG